MGFAEENYKGKVPLSPHFIKDTYYQCDITVGVDLDPLIKVMFASFLHYICTLFYLLSTLHSLEGSHYTQPKPKEWGNTFHIFEGRVST